MEITKSDGEGGAAIDAGRLCQACGICCDGTLFGHVSLSSDEIQKMESYNVKIIEDKGRKPRFLPPCPCFKEGSCSIYVDRPRKCVSYHCKLQKAVMNGTVEYEESLKLVDLVKKYTEWVKGAILDPDKSNSTHLNYRDLLKKYHVKATELNQRGKLSRADEARINRIFEQLKLIDRYFEETRLIRSYASLIQSFQK